MKLKRVVAIVGMSPVTREMANEEPPDVEIWGTAVGYLFLKRWSRWFEMHKALENGLYPARDQRHFDFLWECNVPIYQQEIDPRLPTSVVFPFHEVGKQYRPYWTSSIAFMLSLAVYERVDEIHLWGVDMASGVEYERQRPCCEYWLGRAEAQGIKLVIPSSSPILRPYGATYGRMSNRFVFGRAELLDEIALVDAAILNANGSNATGLAASRQALVALLHKADPSTIGKPVRTPVITGEAIDAGRIAMLAEFHKVLDG